MTEPQDAETPPRSRLEAFTQSKNPLVRGFLALWDIVFLEALREAEPHSAKEMAQRQPGAAIDGLRAVAPDVVNDPVDDASVPPSRSLDAKVIIVMVTMAVSLTFLEYYGMSNEHWRFVKLFEWLGADNLAVKLSEAMTVHPDYRIYRLAYWSAGCFTAYFIIPAFVIKVILRENISDYGLRLTGVLKHWWVYLTLLVPVLILVYIVSADEHFQQTYPFYDLAPDEGLWPHLFQWEAMYVVQFFALEFFFRGFVVQGTKDRFGWYSILVMMVPYCMIHYGKPLPETLGAIIAGIVLGSLALGSRSIWLGVAIHATVALTMDFGALWRTGMLF